MTTNVLVAQLGARMHYGVPRILNDNGLLCQLYTDLVATKGWPRILRAIPSQLRPQAVQRLLGRVPTGIDNNLVTTYPCLGLYYRLRVMAAKNESERTAVYLEVGRKFNEAVLASGLKYATHVYAFSSAARELLLAARDAGLKTIVEQPSTPRAIADKILAPEYEEYKTWEMNSNIDRNRDLFIAREREEWKIADYVVAPSRFVISGLDQEGVSADRCIHVPYGVDDSYTNLGRTHHSGPLRVLTIASLRLLKGPQYTLQAAKMISRWAEVRLVGPNYLSDTALRDLSKVVSIIGSVPRSQIYEHYRWADVFLLPSLCEGMATVLIEAMAAGLPIITTKNSGVEIRDGVEGYIVPIRDAESIAEKVCQFVNNRNLLYDMSIEAKKRYSDFSLYSYAQRLLDVLSTTSRR